jgi:hypothetical protein
MKERILIALTILAFGCTDDVNLPTVTTTPITEITWEYALTGGEVIDNGGAPVIARGVCASEDSNYLSSLDDYGVWYTMDGSGLGSFTSAIKVQWHGAAMNLRSTHYVRAYATNSEGTAFGKILSFYPGDKPLFDNSLDIKTIEVTATTATVNYTFYYQIFSTVREMGMCYATYSEPTVNDECIVISDISDGENTLTIENLVPNTKYYIRSYDINQAGVYYSSVKSFTTEN